MDAFTNLSLDDPDQLDIDPQPMAELSLTDENKYFRKLNFQNNWNNIPLKDNTNVYLQSSSDNNQYLEENHLESDIDMLSEADTIKTPSKENRIIESDEAKEDEIRSFTVHSPKVLHNILSPTQLGASAARRSSTAIIQRQNDDDDDDIANLKWKDRPIHVSINNNNNNNFFYQDPNGYTSIYDNKKEDKLPPPWSSQSSPVSRLPYNFYSYLQLTLNSLTGTLIIWFLLSSFKKDIHSLWYADRRQLFLESQTCQENWNINNCIENGKLPALTDRCMEWQRCMTRDNDKLFGTRSLRIVSLLGQLINGFIQPIGWKPITIVLIGILSWLFITNFLMGFLRAKYYYKQDFNQIKDTDTSNANQYEDEDEDDDSKKRQLLLTTKPTT
ncbi:similar to Saccharomyces cerevisiae YHR036W BRL1 Essential nuclear envelope integral membrane protein identified as a suppressor of a conditional mutation in the major karyopherin, CRM1 [Maudiozyma saulgeensis]|uniref:Similar to Saccharomyces cerevisiae YHR036W BRL1 Essential nuclear envelope integral membrane protein identified as a suppressor of a conditional mutation in the major karyopherin, CRM1 n=1 Tax=Maudiozyma saulgeensis TaxID=1789683 RepID=A0A1X7QZN3_9SACH|nr:similar to Saccharomyces cerevisiae YHR036W BRL1 Essential nuclear envelope integral membrane protein identified as a suppressor of a conditional mutation in the major karyopherin, CRM1 [Kazachstania saulgeensis]